jgi:hypothetical protein
MSQPKRRSAGRTLPPWLLALCVVAAAAVAAAPKFLNVWKAPEVTRLNFAGKKVAAVVMTDDQSLQMSAEESLSRELNARKVNGVASYRIVPREEMKNAATARGWFDRAEVQGVVALRPVEARQEQRPSSIVWTSGYYPSFWNYYGHGWATTYAVPLSVQKTTTVVVEVLIYDLTQDRLVWAATSETREPRELQRFITDLVSAAVDEMRRNKLVG